MYHRSSFLCFYLTACDSTQASSNQGKLNRSRICLLSVLGLNFELCWSSEEHSSGRLFPDTMQFNVPCGIKWGFTHVTLSVMLNGLVGGFSSPPN